MCQPGIVVNKAEADDDRQFGWTITSGQPVDVIPAIMRASDDPICYRELQCSDDDACLPSIFGFGTCTLRTAALGDDCSQGCPRGAACNLNNVCSMAYLGTSVNLPNPSPVLNGDLICPVGTHGTTRCQRPLGAPIGERSEDRCWRRSTRHLGIAAIDVNTGEYLNTQGLDIIPDILRVTYVHNLHMIIGGNARPFNGLVITHNENIDLYDDQFHLAATVHIGHTIHDVRASPQYEGHSEDANIVNAGSLLINVHGGLYMFPTGSIEIDQYGFGTSVDISEMWELEQPSLRLRTLIQASITPTGKAYFLHQLGASYELRVYNTHIHVSHTGRISYRLGSHSHLGTWPYNHTFGFALGPNAPYHESQEVNHRFAINIADFSDGQFALPTLQHQDIDDYPYRFEDDYTYDGNFILGDILPTGQIPEPIDIAGSLTGQFYYAAAVVYYHGLLDTQVRVLRFDLDSGDVRFYQLYGGLEDDSKVAMKDNIAYVLSTHHC